MGQAKINTSSVRAVWPAEWARVRPDDLQTYINQLPAHSVGAYANGRADRRIRFPPILMAVAMWTVVRDACMKIMKERTRKDLERLEAQPMVLSLGRETEEQDELKKEIRMLLPLCFHPKSNFGRLCFHIHLYPSR